MSRRRLLIVTAVALMLLTMAHPAAAQDLEIELFAPGEAITGQPVEIAAFVREAVTRQPVEGATVVFYGDATFAGVDGELELGRATTNAAGFGILRPSFSVSRVHEVRVELLDLPEVAAASTSIAVSVGLQIIESEAGISIPGVGAWVVTLVIASVWAIMIVAALGMVSLSRRPGPGGTLEPLPEPTGSRGRFRSVLDRIDVAVVATGIMGLVALGLVSLLVRSPETHSNLNPEGYDRTPVAYLEASYVYPGPGHTPAALTGDGVTDGRVLFMSYGCAGCHGVDGQGTAAARTPAFATRQWLGTVVRAGLPGGMPAYTEGDVSGAQLDLMHEFLLDARDRITTLGGPTTTVPVPTTAPPPDPDQETAAVGYVEDIAPLFEAKCSACHGSAGGWSAATYTEVIESGDNGPAVIPGDAANSVLAQKISGTQTFGAVMPPASPLPPEEVTLILTWIQNGAPEEAMQSAVGALIYAERCAVCHGPAGEGGAGPALTGPPLPTAEIEALVADGRGSMGGFAASLTDEEISQVAAFTVTLGERTPGDVPSIGIGAEVFRVHCAVCHAADATGGVGPALTISALDIDQMRAVVSGGRAEMPAFGEALTATEIDSVALFLEDQKVEQDPDPGTDVPHPGSELYAAACATCHGVDARGGIASALAGTNLSANEVITRVYGGHQGGMPAFEGVLSAPQVQDVALYVLELEGDGAANATYRVLVTLAAILTAVVLGALIVWRLVRRNEGDSESAA